MKSMQMLKRLFGALCVLAVIALAGCAETGGMSEEAIAAEVESGSAVVVRFDVTGMHCTGCAATIRSAIARIDGVKRCTVSFDESEAEVVIDTRGAADDVGGEEEPVDAVIRRIIEKVAEDGFTIERRQDDLAGL